MSISEEDPAAGESLTSGRSGRVLLTVVCGTLLCQLGYLILPPLLPSIISTLHITEAQAGAGLSLLTLCTAVFRYPGGKLSDDLSRDTVILLSVLAVAVGFTIVGTAQRYRWLLFGLGFAGIGLGMYVPAGFAALSDEFHKKQGQVFGLNDAAVNVAGVIASFLALLVLAHWTWRVAYIPIVAGLFVITLIYGYGSPTRLEVSVPQISGHLTVVRIFQSNQLRTGTVIAGLFMFAWNGTISFLPVFLESTQGLTRAMSSAVYASIFGLGIFITPLSGISADRFGDMRTVTLTLCIGILGLLMVLLTGSPIGTVIGSSLLAVGLMGFWPPMTSYLMRILSAEKKGSGIGLIGTMYMAVGSLGPSFVGTIGSQYSYDLAYSGFLIVFGVCLLLSLSLLRNS